MRLHKSHMFLSTFAVFRGFAEPSSERSIRAIRTRRAEGLGFGGIAARSDQEVDLLTR